MKSLSFSSGDLIVDRRADYAEMLFAGGECAAAADLMRDALALAPAWAAGWFQLGEMREAAGDPAAASEAWTEALRLDPADRVGASLKLARVGAAHGLDAPPSAFVEALFDQYAESFDAKLVGRLGYRVPELIHAALARAGATRFAHVLDLGCGTGLMGERLRSFASFIEGYDISAGMLRKAAAKRVYDRLERVDLQRLEAGERRADLVAIADVLMYLGALDRILSTVADMTLPGGLLAFSLERHDGPEPMVLRASRRYAHSEPHLRDLLARLGFEIVSIDREPIRFDRGQPIEGLIVVARRGGAAERMDGAAIALADDIVFSGQDDDRPSLN